jgi:hypothetical protein
MSRLLPSEVPAQPLARVFPFSRQTVFSNRDQPMRRVLLATTAGLALAMAAAPAAHAQVNLGLAGGPVSAVGQLANVVNAGFHGGVAVDLGIPLLPFGVRADAMFQRMPGAGGGADFNQLFGTLNGRVGLLPIPLVSAYATAGAGLYSSSFTGDGAADGGRSVDTGFNAGVGARVNLIFVRPFVEARYHRVLTEPARDFIPISVGVFF